MQLGKKTTSKLHDALSHEIAEPTVAASPSPPVTPAAQETLPSQSSSGIQILLNEVTSVKSNRDGGLESLDVQGQLNLYISDSTMTHLQLSLLYNDSDGTQFKTHPNVDRNLFKDHSTIALRDPSRPFSLNQQMTLLRWRLQGKNKREFPISSV